MSVVFLEEQANHDRNYYSSPCRDFTEVSHGCAMDIDVSQPFYEKIHGKRVSVKQVVLTNKSAKENSHITPPNAAHVLIADDVSSDKA